MISVGCGYYVEMTLDEAFCFIEKKLGYLRGVL
jgi:prefoldin subunit 5